MSASADTAQCHHDSRRISWSAIVTGALIGVGLSFLMNLLGVAVGLSAFSMGEHGVVSLAIGGLLGLIVSTIIAMFFAGFSAGYIGRLYVPKHNMGIIYGFTTWSVSLILAAILTTYIGNYVNSYSSNISRSTIVFEQDQPTAQKPVQPQEMPSAEEQQKMMAVAAHEATTGIAAEASIVFILFFVGALSSCIGAHFGMRRRCDNE